MAVLERVFMRAEHRKLLARYRRLREASRRVNSRLLEMLTGSAIRKSAKDLGMLVDGTVVCRSQRESELLFDYALHDYRPSPSAKSAVERFVSPAFDREAATLDKDEATVRRNRTSARFAILQVQAVLPGLGIHVDDLLWREQGLLLTDVGLSRTAPTGGVFIARIMQVEGFWMTTALGVPVDADTLQAIVDELAVRYGQRLSQPERLRPADWSAIVRRVLRICRHSGMTDDEPYGAPDPPAADGGARGLPALVER